MNDEKREADMLRDKIEESLRNYRCQYTVEIDYEDSGAHLVDILTPPHQETIALGQAEIELLSDRIASDLDDAGYAAATRWHRIATVEDLPKEGKPYLWRHIGTKGQECFKVQRFTPDVCESWFASVFTHWQEIQSPEEDR